MTGPTEPVLAVEELRVEFGAGLASEAGSLVAVADVSFEVAPGETVALVGESGSGKTVTALAIVGLIEPPGRVVSGQVRFADRDLTTLVDRELQRLRGGELAMVFQDPLSALNPSMRVGHQIAEAVRVHAPALGRTAARARAVELLDQVGIAQPEARARAYPHQLSGGMRQRVMIAMAIANRPRLLVADEPTTALDVTVQAHVLEVLATATRTTGAALLLITHDLGIVAGLADRVLVMYAGRIVESGSLDDLFRSPRHPYTRGLLAALPRLDAAPRAHLPAMVGTPASEATEDRCAFEPRCPYAIDRCATERPELDPVDRPRHRSACWRAADLDQLVVESAR